MLQLNVNAEKMSLSKNTGTRNHGTFHNIESPKSKSNIVSISDSERKVVENYNNIEDIVDGVRFRRQRSTSFRKPSEKRLVEKSGKRNVRSKVFPRDRYLQDIFTTIIDAKWKWMIVLFVGFYLGSWLLFGFFWWIIRLAHGKQCFDNVNNFTEAFLLSLETSMTIGYGGRQVTSDCPEAVILLIIQSLVSCIIEACIIGLIFTKVARPGKRQSTIVFSKNAVITKRDDKLCLMFNIADVRKKQLGECHVRLHLFRTYKTLEGNIIQNQQNQLRVGMDWYNIRDDSDRLFLLFPCSVTHVIDRKSPFYNVSREMYKNSDWELVVILEGVVEATGCVLQARTSYLPGEVYWGKDFVDMATHDDWHEEQGILYMLQKINETVPAPYVPNCSALTYYEQIGKYPDPDEVYATQDELWDDQNFTEPGVEPRVLPTHEKLTESENNVVI